MEKEPAQSTPDPQQTHSQLAAINEELLGSSLRQNAQMLAEIAERKATEEKLRASEERFRAAVGAVGGIIWTNNANGHMEGEQSAWGAFTGQRLEEYQGNGWAQAVHPEDAKPTIDAWNLAVSEKRTFDFEHRVRRHDGAWRQCFVRAVPVLDGGGEIREWVGVHTDITERKQAEEELRQGTAIIQTISESTGDVIFAKDLRGSMTYANPATLELIGKPLSEVLGQTDADFLTDKAAACQVMANDRRIMDRGIPEDLEEWVPLPDGRLRTWLSRKVPYRDGKGNVVGLLGISRDITERKESESKLLAANETFRHLVEHSPFGVYVVDADFRVAQMSAGGQKAFENVRPLIGRDFAEAMHILWPENIARGIIAIFHRVLDTGEPYHAPSMVEARADIATVEAYDWKADRITLPDGRPGVVCHFYDFSERQRYEARLGESEERYRGLFESLLEGYCLVEMIYDADGSAMDYRFLETNPTFEAQSGLKDAKGRTILELAPDVESSWIETFAKVAETGKPVRFEMEAAALHRWFEVQGYPINEAGSKKVGIVFNDITESQAAERALRESESRMRIATEATAVGIWEWNVLTRRIRWDAQMFRLYGTPPTPDGFVQYADWCGRVLPEDLPENERILQDTVRRHGHSRRQFRILRQDDGAYRDLESVETVRMNAQGEPEWVLGTNLDITERKRAEERVRLAKEAAETADAAKDRFLAMLSHELRTPLTPVLLAVGMLQQNPELSVEVRDDLAMMKRNIDLETKLIDDLLDLTRVTSGKLVLELAPVDLNEAVRHVCGICQSDLAGHRIHLDIRFDSSAGFVAADAARLQQVLWNVLRNAIKFTPEGGTIQVATERQAGDRVEVRVHDSGMGIAPEVLPLIFQAFEQGEADTTQKFGGLGLGLAISRGIVDLHGGSIRAESGGLDQGATFSIVLPAALPAPQAAAPAMPSGNSVKGDPGAPVRVLLVEDHADTVRVLARILSREGFVVTVASDVASAHALLGRDDFDILVSDIGLPDGSGIDIMRELRSRSSTPGIVMSGYGREEDVQRSLEAGFSEHLVKPVDPNKLKDAIQRVTKTRVG